MIVNIEKSTTELFNKVAAVALCVASLIIFVAMYSNHVIGMKMFVLLIWAPCVMLVIGYSDYKEMVQAFVLIINRIRKEYAKTYRSKS